MNRGGCVRLRGGGGGGGGNAVVSEIVQKSGV